LSADAPEIGTLSGTRFCSIANILGKLCCVYCGASAERQSRNPENGESEGVFESLSIIAAAAILSGHALICEILELS
jgi:hypothetical protein